MRDSSLKISVVTPCYNHVEFVGETIKSVVGQNYPNPEYIIIDGGSTDGSAEIIKSYADQLAYWVSERDSGHGSAINKGFAQSTGEVMAWINSDDKYLPWTFDVVSQVFMSNPDVEWIVGVPGIWNEQGHLVEVRAAYKNVYDLMMGNYEWIQQESVFWRRSLWDRAGAKVDEEYEFMVDGELWCRFFQYAELWHLPVLIGGYRMHGSNRALENYGEVKLEMESAISIMKQRLPADVLKTFAELSRIRKLSNRLYSTKIPLDWLRVLKWIFRRSIDNAYYPILVRESGFRWGQRRKHWSV